MYEEFRSRVLKSGTYTGEIMRNKSNMVVDATWMNSVSTYPVMVQNIESGLPPVYTNVSEYQNPLYAHFETKSVYNVGGSEPSYYLTFQPGIIATHPEIKIGSYVNIPSVDGVCQYWIIVHFDDDNELIKAQILKATWTLKWVTNNVIYQSLCVIRNSTSENIGVETVGQLSTVDSDIAILLPTNEDTRTIGYDTRFLISDEMRMPPLAWKTSRIRDVGPIGITRLNLSQDLYNPTTDDYKLGIANYRSFNITSDDVPKEETNITISYNGAKPVIKVGSGKVFTANLSETDNRTITWSVNDGNEEYQSSTTNYILEASNHTLGLKVAKNYNLIGTVLTIKAMYSGNVIGDTKVEVIG